MNPWYESLAKPPLTPPNWVFGPVWTVPYVMIAVAIVLYLRRPDKPNPALGYGLLAVHLAANFAWTPLFFRLHSPGWALVDIAVLDATLVALIVLFWPVSRIAALLLLPYLAWVGFASYLNAGFYLLNRTG